MKNAKSPTIVAASKRTYKFTIPGHEARDWKHTYVQ